MKKLSRETRQRLNLLACVLGVAVIILLLPTWLTAPARVVFTQAVGPLEEAAFHAGGDVLATSGTLRDAFLEEEYRRSQELKALRQRNNKARLENLRLLQELRLRSMNKLRLDPTRWHPYSTVVTAYDSSHMHQSMTIAAGTKDGVRKGMAVCSAGAVVGKVIEAGPWRSRVRFITDAASSLPCRVSRTRRMCVLQGTGGANCRVEWLDRDASVRGGQRPDVLVTAPVDDLISDRPLIPPGLPVATIMQVERGRTSPFFLNVTAAPRVNLQRLEVVEVIIPTPLPVPLRQSSTGPGPSRSEEE